MTGSESVTALRAAVLPAGKRRGWIYLMLFLLNAINFLDRVVLSVDGGSIAKEFHLSPVALGYLFSSYLWTYTLFLIPVGMAVDRWGPRISLAVGVTFWSLMTSVTGVVSSLGGLLVTRFGLGIGEAVSAPGGSRTIRQWAPLGERGFAFTCLSSGIYGGSAFGVAVIAWLTTMLGWRGAFVVAGLIGLVWAIVWIVWVRQPENTSWISESEREKILTERDDTMLAGRQSAPLGGFLQLLKSGSMWGIFFTQGCSVYTQYLFISWLPGYLQASRHLSLLKTGLFSSIPYIVAVIMLLLVGRFSDRVLSATAAREGKRRLLVVASMLVSAIVLFTPLVNGIWPVIILISISLSGAAAAIALTSALLADLVVDARDQGKAVGLMGVGGNLFGLGAPIATGYVVQATGGFDGAFLIAGVLLVGGSMAALFATRNPIGQRP